MVAKAKNNNHQELLDHELNNKTQQVMVAASGNAGISNSYVITSYSIHYTKLYDIIAGYARGWLDDVVQYVYTTLNSIPHVLLIA